MKYAFVSVSIVFIWIATIMLVYFLRTDDILLPVTALLMTVALFFIGFAKK